MDTIPDRAAIVRGVSIFGGLPDEAIHEITHLLEDVQVTAGDNVFEKGDSGACLYIVASGKARVHDGLRALDEVKPGDVFGEMAVLDPAPRSASVTAVEDMHLLRLERDQLFGLIERQPAVAGGIIRVLSRRLRARLDDMSSLHGRKEEMERELAIGRQIQAGFLPLTLPRPPGWELAARFEPAKEVAGDFYDAFPLPGGSLLGIVIADVSGKGVGAALFVALTRTLLRAYAEHNFAQLRAGEQMDGDAVARAIATTVSGTNDYVAGVHGSAHMFATVFFGVLDVSAGDLRYCSAGHDPPAITGEAGIRAALMPTGPAVGLLPGMPFAVEQAQIAPGEMLAMYTDGVTDAQDANGLMFGKDALMALIGEPLGTAAALVERIEASLKAHIAGAAQFDDITLLAVKRSAGGQ